MSEDRVQERPRAPAVGRLAAGELLAPGLRVARHLHRSKHGDVYEVIDERHDGARFAAKVVRPDRRGDVAAVERILVEGVRLACIRHPSVLRCVETIDEPPGNLLELIVGPSLHDRVEGGERLPWREVARLGAQLASALEAVHATGLLHGDVKPKNVLCAPDRFVLIDLDLAYPSGPSVSGRGTRAFMAPEQMMSGVVGPAIDAWGLGMTMFSAATGHLPFDDRHPQTRFLARSIEEVRPGGGAVAAIIDHLLAPLPEERPLLGWVAAELAVLD